MNVLKSGKCVCFSILFNCFRPSETLIFQLIFHRIFMFFQNRSRGTVFRGSQCQALLKSLILCHYRFSGFPKSHPLDNLFDQKCIQNHDPFPAGRVLGADPAFHETTVITVPLGHRGFQKVRFFDGDWFIFCFCCVSLCCVLYSNFVACFHKTSVNAKPLSAQNFEEIAAHLKKKMFLIFAFAFDFFRLFYIFVYLRGILADRLGQICFNLYRF